MIDVPQVNRDPSDIVTIEFRAEYDQDRLISTRFSVVGEGLHVYITPELVAMIERGDMLGCSRVENMLTFGNLEILVLSYHRIRYCYIGRIMTAAREGAWNVPKIDNSQSVI